MGKASPLAFAHRCTRRWFETSFPGPTDAQRKGWAPISAGDSTLLLAPTGSGKTLSAFLVAIDRLMFREEAPKTPGVRVLYLSPLKALGVDVERNLRAPLNGIRVIAERTGEAHRVPTVGVRSGDTEEAERRRMRKTPPEILITTPESLYLMLTSSAREGLSTVTTVIVDEIHALVANKRGAHLFLSLERLNQLTGKPCQRIGLSATQRPLEEIARLLGGFEVENPQKPGKPRPVTIVDASAGKTFDLRVEVPVEDMAQLDAEEEVVSGPAHAGPRPPSIWPSITPRLVSLIQAHRSTILFVNSRRLAERLAEAINELAAEAPEGGDPKANLDGSPKQSLVRAHHGSVAKDVRAQIEDELKRGVLPGLVATSSLELGIDMGAVDQVIQIEAPPSVASGVQRIGRAGHQVGASSRGVFFPKFRGDLLACAAVTQHIHASRVEAAYYPRNPLDVLAQQVVAMAVGGPMSVDACLRVVRSAAPFAELTRRAFEGVLDMLSGRYASDEFSDLRPRLTWDRIKNELTPRKGARMLAIANGGTIPDRGLYGVFLAHQDKSVRVGELDEEMVFESREGDVFVLGASSWRIEEITHDRVLVVPAPGEAGKMPFWHGDRMGRPLEFGQAIGALARKLKALPRTEAEGRLVEQHGLDRRAADNLLRYLADQSDATGQVPHDRQIVIEAFVDEVGDLCVCVLSPFGGRVHAPWSTAIRSTLHKELGYEPDTMWSDDGMVFRLPDTDGEVDPALFVPAPDEVERLVVDALNSTALFASRFRENAARALLLPRRRPGQRTPLWAQRRKSASLLKVASGYPDFPILLETYRECLRDVFDLPGLTHILSEIQSRRVRVHALRTKRPSPFSSSLLFNYAANFIYEGDVPLAERRTQMLTLDHAQLRELLGEPVLRELLDLAVLNEVEKRLQRLSTHPVKHADGLHDLLLAIGDLGREDIRARALEGADVDGWIEELKLARRVVEVPIAGETRCAAVEDMARLRDALGIVPPPGLPAALLEPVAHPLRDLVARYARTHGPFRVEDVAARFGLGVGPIRTTLEQLLSQDRVLEGEFIPGGRGAEWVDVEVLRQIKRRSLAQLRKAVEAVPASAFGRFALDWAGLGRHRATPEAVLGVIEELQGAPIAASSLERLVLPGRLRGYDRRDLDELCASGEVLFRGMGGIGAKDGKVALYLAEHFALLAPRPTPVEGELAARIRERLTGAGGLFFRDLVSALGAFGSDVLSVLWDMVWSGEVTNDTLLPLRTLRGQAPRSGRRKATMTLGRRNALPGSEGRWSLLPYPADDRGAPTPTERLEAMVKQLLNRYGVLTREAVLAEGIAGGFSAIYPVLRAMEEAGRVRRGYFVEGLGATQFALPGAVDRLRAHRDVDPEAAERTRVHTLAADDPANLYGAALRWPERKDRARPARAAGARVVLADGSLVGYIGPSGRHLLSFLPEAEPERGEAQHALTEGLRRMADGSSAVLIRLVDGEDAPDSHLNEAFAAASFVRTRRGWLTRRSNEASGTDA